MDLPQYTCCHHCRLCHALSLSLLYSLTAATARARLCEVQDRLMGPRAVKTESCGPPRMPMASPEKRQLLLHDLHFPTHGI